MAFFEDLQNAVKRLDEVLKLEKNPINRDSAIKRFEICFDLSWKALKHHALKEGLECYSPRSCFQVGFQLGVIDYDDQWLRMIEDRNRTSHLYGETLADEVYKNLPAYLNLFSKLISKIQK